jgi:hypothetical protein
VSEVVYEKNNICSDDLVSHMERFLDTFANILHPNNYIMVTGTHNRFLMFIANFSRTE